jgi:glycosyltransferase 2 family protein
MGFALRLLVTALVLAYLFFRADLAQVLAAMRRIPVASTCAAFATLLAGLAAGVVRWRALLVAYGAHGRPRWGDLARWYLVAGFYNLLPGAVGGDVLRGYATRSLFADSAAVRSLSVVFVERVLGFAGLLVLAAAASAFSPFARAQVLLYSSLGLASAVVAVLAIASGRRFSSLLPARLAHYLDDLPTLVAPASFAAAVVLSVVSQLCASAAGQFLLASIAPVSWADSLVIFPIATLAAFFPFTVAGAGARDGVLVVLLGRLGVAPADALAASLALLACHLALATSGALVRTPTAPEPA